MPRSSTSPPVELLVRLDQAAATPLHHQLERQLRDGVRSGRLRPGSALPSTRALAGELGLSRGVVVEAYEQLVAEGYLASRQGGATRVAEGATPATEVEARPIAPSLDVDFKYGRPDVSQFPRSTWLRSLRRVLADAPSERFSYLDGRGAPELRDALAAYLGRVRGVCAEADRIIVCSGFGQGIALLCGVLKAAGARSVAVEDPSEDCAAAAIRRSGLELIGIPVDDQGLRVDLLERTSADAVLVTAAHQFPTGAVLPADRRAALVAWATRRGALIVEDDYDAEFRYDREPIGAIQGLAPDRVVYAGSASKTLAPGLRLGWLQVPAALAGSVAAAKEALDRGSPVLDQLAFADFLDRGEFDRHLRRMRPIYRRRRDALLGALARHAPELRPVGASAGLHVLAWLPPGIEESSVVGAAAALGVGVYGLAPYRIAAVDGPQGLLFGYAGLNETSIEAGIRLLATALDAAREGRSQDRATARSNKAGVP